MSEPKSPALRRIVPNPMSYDEFTASSSAVQPDAPIFPLVSWYRSFARGDERMVIRRAHTDAGVLVLVTAGEETHTTFFRETYSAIQHQRDIEERLLHDGWTLAPSPAVARPLRSLY
jgi:hypothetical protein